MSGLRVAAIALIVAGVLALAFGRFSWMRERDVAQLGPVRMAVMERRGINIPVWAGLAGIVAGAGLLAWGSKPR